MYSVSSNPLGIALLGMNDRDRSRLELFLDHHWSSNCLLVSEKQADLCILDLDSLHGKKILQQQKVTYPHRPLIVLSVHEAEISDVSHLRKPLSTDRLKSAINGFISALAQNTSEEKEVPAKAPEPAPISQERPSTDTSEPTVNKRRSALPGAATQARIIRGSCGPSGDIDLNNPTADSKLFYDPGVLFQQVLKSGIEKCRQEARPVRLSMPDKKYVTLLPEANIAFTNLSDTKLRSRCLLPINQHEIHIDYPSSREIDQLQANMEASQDIDGLLWKVSLWSARGRLPIGTSADTTIELQQWPNLTRLLAIPHFLRIAALWTKTPMSLTQTVETLNIEARYVCAFFSACYALELTQLLSMAEDRKVSQKSAQKSSTPKGVLRRILRRLRVA
ncbi:MAG: hypothetical protein P8Z77_04015 [Candidatus Thiodiazotropha sp.]